MNWFSYLSLSIQFCF